MPSIAITGASGALGRRTAELVLERHWDPEDVLLLTRTPERLADLAARGARVERAKFENPTGLKGLLAGVERLLLVSLPDVGARIEPTRQAIAAAERAGVGQVVYTSVVRPSSDNPALLAADHAGAEQAIRESGMEWTFLRNNLYGDLAALQAPGIAEAGVLVTNAGDGGTAYVSREDCARAAAAVLTTDGHERETYAITGPEAITQRRLAELVQEYSGLPVEFVEQDDEDQRVSLEEAGLPAPLAALVASIGEATRKGFFAKVTGDVEELTGRAPQPLEQLLAAAFGR